jgi:hypothetical protein
VTYAGLSGQVSLESRRPRETLLHQGYPDAATGSMDIAFELAKAGHMTLKVHDAAGREVATLLDGRLEPGRHTATWIRSAAPSGVYSCTLSLKQDDGRIVTRRNKLFVPR